MIRAGTVFILGAGASKELGFPLGVDLRTKIKEICARPKRDGFHNIPTRLEELFHGSQGLAAHVGSDVDRLVAAQRILVDSIDAVDSIDQFLGLHADDQTLVSVGKIAIARSILEAERRSAIYWNFDKRVDPTFAGADIAWNSCFQRIWVLLSDGLDNSSIDRIFEGVTFINFNYDRSLEYFFYVRLRQLLQMPHERASQIVGSMNVMRPYGSVGVDAYDRSGAAGKVPFGADLSGAALLASSKQVRIISEDRVGLADGANDARSALARSRNVVLLGCAYHQANLNLLEIAPESATARVHRQRRVWGTAYGIDDIGLPYVQAELERVLRCQENTIVLSNKHTAANLCAALNYRLRQSG